jgi:hypothetical protein
MERRPTQDEEKTQITLRTRREGGVPTGMNAGDLFPQFFGEATLLVNCYAAIEIAAFSTMHD